MIATIRRAWTRIKKQYHEPNLDLSDAEKNEWGPLLDCGHRSHAIAQDPRDGITRCLACYHEFVSQGG